MFKSTTTYKVGTDIWFSQLFPNGIQTDTFYNKGRCGIGATTSEIKNLIRSSIIVVPNIGIIKNKCTKASGILGVYGDVDILDVANKLAEHNTAQKIMCTPESITKVANAFIAWSREGEMYQKWFLLLDEVHTFISEDYRKDILKPFDHFWKFNNKAMLSATPYLFSDKRFNDLHYINITFNEKLGTINLVDAVSIQGTLNYILKTKHPTGTKLHIFYNSVTEIVRAIRNSGITKFNIYCAGDKNNFVTMGDLESHYVAEPAPDNFAEINFYTTRYFEGWDMFDKNAVIIMVTDIHKPHTVVSTGMKLKQAAGRLRDQPLAIYHITNHRHMNTRKTLLTLKHEDLKEATLRIESYNSYVENCNQNNIVPRPPAELGKIAQIDKTSSLATLHPLLLDQQIHEAASNETYNHPSFIKQEWEDAYFDVNTQTSSYLLDTPTQTKRRSKADILKADYEAIQGYNNREDGIFYFDNPADTIKQTNPLAYQASLLLSEARMEELKWKPTAVQEAVTIASTAQLETKLLKLLSKAFTIGQRYTIEQIRIKLQGFYNALDYKDIKGNAKVAEATHLGNNGRFEIEKCKVPDGKGGYVNGYKIIRAQFEMRIAA